MTGHPPVQVVADADIRGSGPVESGQMAPTMAGWRELAGATSPRLGTLDATRFLRLLSSDGIVRGTALVPVVIAGSDLSVFPLGLFGVYLSRPGIPERRGEFNAPFDDVWMPVAPLANDLFGGG